MHHPCVVAGCGDSKVRPLHRFPSKDFERQKMWILAAGNPELLLLSTITEKRICSRHFETKYKIGASRLAKTAVPTLHLPGKLF